MHPVRVFMLSVLILTLGLVVSSATAEFEGYWLQKSETITNSPMTGEKTEIVEQKVFFKQGMMKIVVPSEKTTTILLMD